jgi:Ni,Fe-hydrogenase I cytochrome b subunit
MTVQHLIKNITRWLLVAVAVVLLVTGLGITEFRIVEYLSFGLLTKSLAQKIHTMPGLWISFLVLLVVHISLSFISRTRNKRGSL